MLTQKAACEIVLADDGSTDATLMIAEILEELQNPTDEKRLAEIARCIREAYDYVNIAKQYWEYMNRVASGDTNADAARIP